MDDQTRLVVDPADATDVTDPAPGLALVPEKGGGGLVHALALDPVAGARAQPGARARVPAEAQGNHHTRAEAAAKATARVGVDHHTFEMNSPQHD
jgi:hypothetical protein